MSSSQSTDLFSLANKSVLISGGAGLLGRVFSQALVDAGADLAIIDLNQDAADSTARQIRKSSKQRVIAIGCDITSPDFVEKTVDQVVAELGKIDVLINNAATKGSNIDSFFAPFEKYSLETWREVMAVNIDGYFLMAQAVGKHMIHRGKGGSIIQTSSIYGVVAPDHRIYEKSEYEGRAINTPAVYSTSKAAVNGLTSFLATYWAKDNIRVNSLTPGGIASGQNEEFNRRYSNRVPLGRMGQADELVGALIYLASDAASYVTGQNLIVDGGLSVW